MTFDGVDYTNPGGRITAWTILSYLLGGGVFVLGLLYALNHLIGGLIIAIGGLWMLPGVRRRVLGRNDAVLSGGAIALVAVLMVGAGFGFILVVANQPSAEFQSFEEDVRAEGIDIEAVDEEERRWVVEYYHNPPEDGPALADLGVIAMAYAEHVPSTDAMPQHQSLDVILLRQDGQRVSSVSISASDARDVASGEMSPEEYENRVLRGVLFGALSSAR